MNEALKFSHGKAQSMNHLCVHSVLVREGERMSRTCVLIITPSSWDVKVWIPPPAPEGLGRKAARGMWWGGATTPPHPFLSQLRRPKIKTTYRV
jgi:hypothetical protein